MRPLGVRDGDRVSVCGCPRPVAGAAATPYQPWRRVAEQAMAAGAVRRAGGRDPRTPRTSLRRALGTGRRVRRVSGRRALARRGRTGAADEHHADRGVAKAREPHGVRRHRAAAHCRGRRDADRRAVRSDACERNGPWAASDISLSRFDQCVCHYERRCRRARPCIDDISVDEVIAAVERRITSR